MFFCGAFICAAGVLQADLQRLQASTPNTSYAMCMKEIVDSVKAASAALVIVPHAEQQWQEVIVSYLHR
jgi:hypothetical protein